MQKIAIIGGTGMTGQCAVEYAIKKGKFFVFDRNVIVLRINPEN